MGDSVRAKERIIASIQKHGSADGWAFPFFRSAEKPSLTPALSRKRERGLEGD